MIWKLAEIFPEPSAPFALDALDRRVFVEHLSRLVASATAPFVLAVDAPWGTGKTTFLRMWRAHLQSLGHPTLLFDAWKSDFLDDPLIGLVGEIEEEVKRSGAIESDKTGNVREALRNVKVMGAGALRRAVPALIKAGTAGIVDATELSKFVDTLGEELGDELAKAAEDRLSKYRAEKAAVDRFRSALERLVAASTASRDDSSSLPLVFMIDELDRCRPDYAVTLLERVKHLFSVPGIVFVLGLDREQLAASVKAVYGSEFGASGYLRRFIDLEFRLPYPAAEKAVQYLFDQAAVLESCRALRDPVELVGDLKATFAELAQRNTIAFRTLEQLLLRLNIILRTWPARQKVPAVLVAALLILKAIDPPLYADYIEGKLGAGRVVERLRAPTSDVLLSENLGYLLEGYLYAYSKRPGERADRLTQARNASAALRSEVDETRFVEDPNARLIEWLESLPNQGRYLDTVAERIEMTDRFALG